MTRLKLIVLLILYQLFITLFFLYFTDDGSKKEGLLLSLVPSAVLFLGLIIAFIIKKALSFVRSILVLNSPLGLANRLVEREGESLYFYGIGTRGICIGIIITRPIIKERTTFVLAGSHTDYLRYIKENDLSLKSNIFYLDDYLRLRGYLHEPYNVRILRIGDWHKNPASHDEDVLRFEKLTKKFAE